MEKHLYFQQKAFAIYLLIFINLLFVPFNTTRAAAEGEGIYSAFKASGGEMESININGHVEMTGVFIIPEDGEKISKAIGCELGIENILLEDTSEENNTQIHFWGEDIEGVLHHGIVQSAQEGDFKETHMVIDITGNKGSDGAALDGKIKSILGKYGKPQLTTCIIGTYDNEMGQNEKEDIIKRSMDALDAKEIEGLRDENMISIVGYSSKIKEWISYGGNKVNLNMAIRYNSYEDKTYLWMATPLIAIGY